MDANRLVQNGGFRPNTITIVDDNSLSNGHRLDRSGSVASIHYSPVSYVNSPLPCAAAVPTWTLGAREAYANRIVQSSERYPISATTIIDDNSLFFRCSLVNLTSFHSSANFMRDAVPTSMLLGREASYPNRFNQIRSSSNAYSPFLRVAVALVSTLAEHNVFCANRLVQCSERQLIGWPISHRQFHFLPPWSSMRYFDYAPWMQRLSRTSSYPHVSSSATDLQLYDDVNSGGVRIEALDSNEQKRRKSDNSPFVHQRWWRQSNFTLPKTSISILTFLVINLLRVIANCTLAPAAAPKTTAHSFRSIIADAGASGAGELEKVSTSSEPHSSGIFLSGVHDYCSDLHCISMSVTGEC